MPLQTPRYRPYLLLGAIFALAPPASAADERPSLCTTTETAIFSCAVGGKIMSLCATPDLDATKGTMIYRFGRRGAVELTHPETPAHPAKAFTAGVDSSERGDYVRFSRGGFTYTLYGLVGQQNRNEQDGLLITRGATTLSNLKCKGFALSDKAWQLMYRAKLPADEPQSIRPR